MNRLIRHTVIGAGLCAATLSCALNHRPSLPPAAMAELWSEPTDIAQRDLFNGPGGAARAPNPRDEFTFKEIKTEGSNPGYEVEDAQGNEWKVKLGVESRVEVAVSRIVWAIGYHQPDIYYVPAWTLVRDGQKTVKPPGRFRLEPRRTKKDGHWSWRDNPFLHTRPVAGLFVMMVMVNNWDLKSAQNPIMETESGDSAIRRYMVRDLGASFGKSAWMRFGTKDDPDAFDTEPFIAGVEGNRVQFHYRGAWREPHLMNSIAPDDVRWVCELLARLSPAQLSDAFRAGGFTDAESERYVRRLREKIADGLRVGSN